MRDSSTSRKFWFYPSSGSMWKQIWKQSDLQYLESCHARSLALVSLKIASRPEAPRSLSHKKDQCDKDDPKEGKLHSKPAAITSCVPLPSRPRTYHTTAMQVCFWLCSGQSYKVLDGCLERDVVACLVACSPDAL